MNILKTFTCSLLAFIGTETIAYSQTVFPHDTRCDSINIEHYTIHLDVRDFNNSVLTGHTQVIFKPLVNGISTIHLDLAKLTVDSVKDPMGNLLSHTVVTNGFITDLGGVYGIGDSTSVEVYYHGAPKTDPQFGGFYFSSGYAYNIGVSLEDIPHNYGKTWYPCFDNFTTRSTFDLFVTTLPSHDAACGGTFQSTTVNPDLSETHYWKIKQTIPSYLASVAVSDYVFVNKTFTNYLNQPVPVKLAAHASDTTRLKSTFSRLENAFDLFESKWGPYRWDRVGYAVVPITSGAMEHAMNIAYPQIGVAGGANWESIMAHELSHHWWGDLVTCRTAEDMWINEGSAAYCELLFAENVSGRSTYESNVRNAHKKLLQSCHFTDGGYWPLSGVPQDHTYGTTTYTKGADMIHTMRGYLGDAVFFSGLQDLLEQNKFSDMDAQEYRDDLSTITGIDMTNFFADWIFQGGWPHISIDSMVSIPSGGNYQVTVHLKQKLRGRTSFSHGVPITLTLRDNSWHTFEQKINASGETNAVTVTVPFLPVSGYLNRDELISHAVTANYPIIKTTGNLNFDHSFISLQVQSVTDSASVVVEHNWVAADPAAESKDLTISAQRYWRIDGVWPSGFVTNARLKYDGSSTEHLDDLLITGTEDSLILVYRPDRATEWTECSFYTKLGGNVNDKSGTMEITPLHKGEYAFALKGQHAGITESAKKTVLIHPNPTDGIVSIQSSQGIDLVTVTNILGQQLLQKMVKGSTTLLDTKEWAKGTYLLTGSAKNQVVFQEKLIVK